MEDTNIKLEFTDKYKKCSYKDFSRIHSITSYLAMFPPSVPHYFIEHYSKRNDIVFDPFSGRGTTAFEACRMGRIGIGNDLNPLAVCLTNAKVKLPKKQSVLRKLNLLEEIYVKEKIKIKTQNVSQDISMLFNQQLTLKQLLFLKSHLNPKRKVDNFILAILTGIMHGKHRKDGTSMYCSIDMPNTFSMSPNYIRNFIKKHKLKKIKQDVFFLLKQRVKYIFASENKFLQDLSQYKSGFTLNSDAVDSSKNILNKYGKNSVQLIITSPPYLKNIHYGKYNWIRLWLLDKDTKDVDKNVSVYHKTQKIKNIKDNLLLNEYAKYMQELFNSWADILKRESYAFVVIGDIETQNLAKDTWEFIKSNGGCKLKLITILEDNIQEKKVTRIWGAKKGKATKIDRILVLQNT